MIDARATLEKAAKWGNLQMGFESFKDANNARQQLYRLREKIRNNPSDNLNPKVCNCRFEINGRILKVLIPRTPTHDDNQTDSSESNNQGRKQFPRSRGQGQALRPERGPADNLFQR